ncbi:MAG: M20/M25/M40 family metallo-hydrolase, partial [Armatimonadetes bacterium]|nr:M20/M25/M40 family metallo-hydrolase [Armatimonadota bacterium]
VLQPEPRRLQPEALTYSGSTPAGGLVGDLVEGGLGRPEDLQGRPVAGRILLVERGVIPVRDKAQNAANAGARAVIVYNNTAGNVMGTLSQQMAIPAVTISREEGLALVEMLRRGPVRVRLVVETAHETRTTWNVIGTRRGTREPGRALVIGGHYDSVARAPGANDNASGTAVVLEVARAVAGRAYPYTVKFIAFGAEEIGLRGSAHYVQTATDQTIAMVNIDVIGAGNAMVAANGAGNGPLLDLAEHVARRFGITLRRTRMGASDHLSFERRGVPAVFFTRYGGPPIHTPEDKLDHIRPALLREGALVAAHVVDEVASGRSRL